MFIPLRCLTSCLLESNEPRPNDSTQTDVVASVNLTSWTNKAMCFHKRPSIQIKESPSLNCIRHQLPCFSKTKSRQDFQVRVPGWEQTRGLAVVPDPVRSE